MKKNLLKLLRNPTATFGLSVLLLVIFTAIFAPFLTPHDPSKGELMIRLKPGIWDPSGLDGHILGTDMLGRDILTRVLYGSRISLTVGFGSVLFSLLFGGTLGLCAGYFRGRFDDYISRFVDWLMAFPLILFLILVMGVMGPGTWNLIFALTLKGWIPFFRLVRGEVLSEREKAYVEAARAIGRNPFGIMFSEILPNITHTLIVLSTLRMGIVILTEATLSFLGLGVSPHIPAWGSMIAASRGYMQIAWWLPVFPGIGILLTVLSLNLLGEGLRDVLDPRLRK
jgi:peptide/nickel transport system permease protein